MCEAFKSFWEQAPDLESKSPGGKWDPCTSCEALQGAISSDSSSFFQGGLLKVPSYQEVGGFKGGHAVGARSKFAFSFGEGYGVSRWSQPMGITL